MKPTSLTRAESLPNSHQLSPNNPQQSTSGLQPSQQQPGNPLTQSLPVPSSVQVTIYQPSGTSSPSSGLIRPTGSLDLPVVTTVSSYLPGVYQPPPLQRDPAQFVRQGAAAATAMSSTAHGPITTPAVRPPPPPVPAVLATSSSPQLVTAATLQIEQQRIADAKLRRQKELEEANRMMQLQQQQLLQTQNSQLAFQHQQLLQAERAEEMAHQEKLRQLRSAHAVSTVGSLLPPPSSHHLGHSNPYAAHTQPIPIPTPSPLSNHLTPPLPLIQPPIWAHLA